MKKSDIALIVGVILVILISIFAFSGKEDKIEKPVVLSDSFAEVKSTTYSEYKEMLDNNKTFIILIVREGCSYCQKFEPIVKEVVSEKSIPVYQIDIATLEENELQDFQNSNKYLKNNDWGTPTTLVLKGSEVIDSLSGYTEKDEFVKFLDKNVKLPEVDTQEENINEPEADNQEESE